MEQVADALGIESAKEAEAALRSLLSAVAAVPAAFHESLGHYNHSLAQVEAEVCGDWCGWVRDLRKATGEVVGKCHDIVVEVRTLAKPSADKPDNGIAVNKHHYHLAIGQWPFDQAIGDIERAFTKAAARLAANEALRVAGEKAELATVLCGSGPLGLHVPDWKYDRQDLLNECREKIAQAVGTIQGHATSGLHTLQMVWKACERAKVENAEVRLLVAKAKHEVTAHVALPPVVTVEPVVHVSPPAINVTLVQPAGEVQKLAGAPFGLRADGGAKTCFAWSGGSVALRPAMADFLLDLNSSGTATARMEYVTELLESVPVLKSHVLATSKRRADGKADYAAPSLKGRIECDPAVVPPVQ